MRGAESGYYMTTADVARIYRMSEGALRNWRWRGVGPAYVRTPAGRILYRASVVEAWFAAEAVAA